MRLSSPFEDRNPEHEPFLGSPFLLCPKASPNRKAPSSVEQHRGSPGRLLPRVEGLSCPFIPWLVPSRNQVRKLQSFSSSSFIPAFPPASFPDPTEGWIPFFSGLSCAEFWPVPHLSPPQRLLKPAACALRVVSPAGTATAGPRASPSPPGPPAPPWTTPAPRNFAPGRRGCPRNGEGQLRLCSCAPRCREDLGSRAPLPPARQPGAGRSSSRARSPHSPRAGKVAPIRGGERTGPRGASQGRAQGGERRVRAVRCGTQTPRPGGSQARTGGRAGRRLGSPAPLKLLSGCVHLLLPSAPLLILLLSLSRSSLFSQPSPPSLPSSDAWTRAEEGKRPVF